MHSLFHTSNLLVRVRIVTTIQQYLKSNSHIRVRTVCTSTQQYALASAHLRCHSGKAVVTIGARPGEQAITPSPPSAWPTKLVG